MTLQRTSQIPVQCIAIRRGPAIRGWLDGSTCAFSFVMLLLAPKFGTAAAACFLLPWVLIVLRAPDAAYGAIVRNAFMLVLPAFAILSAAWSDYPQWSFRTGIQFFLTTCIGIWAACCIKPRNFLSALMYALIIILIVSVLIEGSGVFASKNQFAFCAVISLLASLCVLSDRGQALFTRAAAGVSMGIAVLVLLTAQSVGALVFCVPAAAVFFGMKALSFFRPAVRAVVLSVLALSSLVFVVVIVSLVKDFGAVLDALGKDSSLTGRDYLWERALDFISMRPVLGVGYQAFWQVGNPPAEDLWFYSSEASGAGFNFHNLYLNTAVELGFVGLAFTVLTLVAIGIRLLIVLFFRPEAHQYFAVIVFIYLMMSSALEVLLMYPFQLGPVLLPVLWCYAKPVLHHDRHSRRISWRSASATKLN
jgi:exopolysaccharide production protein ExoQ